MWQEGWGGVKGTAGLERRAGIASHLCGGPRRSPLLGRTGVGIPYSPGLVAHPPKQGIEPPRPRRDPGLGMEGASTGHPPATRGRAVQRRSCWTRTLARITSFRMTAVIATLGGLPASQRAVYLRLRSGFQRIAVSAGM